MLNYLWEGFVDARLITQFGVLAVVVSGYLYLTVIDFKHKEMELWKVLLVGGGNILLPVIPILIWGDNHLKMLLPLTFILWIIAVSINTKFNNESVIGQADIDIFLAQLSIGATLVLWIFSTVDPKVTLLYVFMIIQMQASYLLYGFAILIAVWVSYIGFIKIRRGISFKESWNLNKQVPSIVAFIPLAVINLLLIMSI